MTDREARKKYPNIAKLADFITQQGRPMLSLAAFMLAALSAELPGGDGHGAKNGGNDVSTYRVSDLVLPTCGELNVSGYRIPILDLKELPDRLLNESDEEARYAVST